jgi:hypothetical protein
LYDYQIYQKSGHLKGLNLRGLSLKHQSTVALISWLPGAAERADDTVMS